MASTIGPSSTKEIVRSYLSMRYMPRCENFPQGTHVVLGGIIFQLGTYSLTCNVCMGR